MSDYKLSHLQELEAESIHIIREVAAEFENPVMLYSIGKDSSVMVRLAEKAFAPGKVPFPLMHIDSKWKFKEMIEFRDSYAKKFGWNLIVESNMEAFHAGVGPFTHGSKVHTDLMKTQALLHALDFTLIIYLLFLLFIKYWRLRSPPLKEFALEVNPCEEGYLLANLYGL